MTAVVLHDSLAVLRARLETDLARFSLSQLIEEINASPHLHFYIWDGAFNKQLRRHVFPDYKSGRKMANPSIFQGLMLLKEVLKHTKAISISVDGYEADDVIATLVKRYAHRGIPIAVNTRDYDLRALVNEGPTVKCTVDPKPDVPDSMIHYFKTWVGDPSDSVPGVKGFGITTWKNVPKEKIKMVTHRVLDGLDISHCNFPPKPLKWVDENRDLFKAMWTVTDFFTVPEEVLNQNMVVGKPDGQAANAMLKEYFL